MALSVVFIILVAGAFMYLLTTFLFNFSSGQSRMGPVVTYGALAVIAGTTMPAAIVWKIRSPSAALTYTAIATPVSWAVALIVEWILSFVFGAG